MLKYIYSFLLFLVSASSLLALLTFDINDNSFLTSSSHKSQNFSVILVHIMQVLFFTLLEY